MKLRAQGKSLDSDVTRIAVVFKTHLDIGFTDFSKKIFRRYIDEYIPTALRMAKQTRNRPQRFVWTTGSWLAYRFLEEAPASQRRLMEEAIREGDFHWHALPFTTHTDLIEQDLFRLGLEFSRQLDERFGRKTIAAKMTDVPGHTIALLPLLAKAGVKFLLLGVNPAGPVPRVPPIFVWRNGKSEIVICYEKSSGAAVRLPGTKALSVNLTGNKLGLQDQPQIDRVYETLRNRYPFASLEPASLNLAAKWCWEIRSQFPDAPDRFQR